MGRRTTAEREREGEREREVPPFSKFLPSFPQTKLATSVSALRDHLENTASIVMCGLGATLKFTCVSVLWRVPQLKRFMKQ